jgi:hypothetical protein
MSARFITLFHVLLLIHGNKSDRMPIPLGEFISQNVYDQKLFSKHKIEDMSCVSFIDVTKGREGKSGKSFIVFFYSPHV